jgi:hypothetical protein
MGSSRVRWPQDRNLLRSVADRMRVLSERCIGSAHLVAVFVVLDPKLHVLVAVAPPEARRFKTVPKTASIRADSGTLR